EIIVARSHRAAVLLRRLCLRLAPPRHRFEGRADVGHFLHAFTDAGEVGIRLDATRPVQVERARLVPVDAAGADGIVDQPALLDEALHMRIAALVEDGLRDAVHGSSPPGILAVLTSW